MIADQPGRSGATDQPAAAPHRSSPPAAPRWVKISGIVVVALILLVVILKLTGVLGEGHGPRRHRADQHSGSAASGYVRMLDR